jgi:hypothetical protein
MDGRGTPPPFATEWPAELQWPAKAAGDMDDNELLEYARLVYRRFRLVPRWAKENDDLLRRWGAACRELGRRGMTETVTEGSGGRDAVALIRETER